MSTLFNDWNALMCLIIKSEVYKVFVNPEECF